MDLQERWFDLCQRLNSAGNEKEAYEGIVKAYSTPPRFWHSLESHITKCLEELDSARNLAQEPDKLELALWLHDSRMSRGQNCESEFQSADFALKLIAQLDLRQSFRETITDLILATRHCLPVFDSDKKLMADIDLAILGKSQAEFDDYETKVRQEYADVPLAEFAAKRSKILDWFLVRKSIYATPYFHAKYEAQARANLQRSIRQLKKLA